MTRVKICDIRDIDTAICCNSSKADYIGLHQIRDDANLSRLRLFNDIIEAAPNAEPVLVTKILDECILSSLVRQVPFRYIQIHEYCPPDKLRTIREEISDSIGLIAVINARRPKIDEITRIARIADFVLIDSDFRGGTGTTTPIEKLNRLVCSIDRTPFFIAGGLNSSNVELYIDSLNPFGVDVQTGVERNDTKHVKDPEKIQAFIAKAKKME